MNREAIIKSWLIKILDALLKLFMIGTIALLASCEEGLEDMYEAFVIPAGQHAGSIPKLQTLQSNTLSFQAIFDQSAIYETEIIENQHDINKLMGFSDCNSHHHDNSARFGWRWLNEKLEIHAYVYNNGDRFSQYIGDVQLHEPYTYELSMNNDFYVFSLEGSDPIYMNRAKACNKGIYYMLFPYFGGDETAPHNILISIKQTSF